VAIYFAWRIWDVPYCIFGCGARGNVDVDLGEACDDGETNSDTAPDACRLDCNEAGCGDGVIDDQHGEVCDDGNTVDGDTCRGDCLQDLSLCGNGTLDPGEACDDGTGNSDAPNDACRTTCRAQGCGDGVLDDQHDEVCDDGNLASHDGCSSGCTVEVPARRHGLRRATRASGAVRRRPGGSLLWRDLGV